MENKFLGKKFFREFFHENFLIIFKHKFFLTNSSLFFPEKTLKVLKDEGILNLTEEFKERKATLRIKKGF